MNLWQTISRVNTATGDDIHLRQRGEIFEIRYNGIELMSNINHHSEDQLALRLLRRMNFGARKILIAGLGLGYTLRAVLDVARQDAEITVCELIPEIVEWNRGPLAHLAGHPLDDPRVKVVVSDIRDHLERVSDQYDLVLLDTDNGPDIVIRPENTEIYGENGMQAVHAATMAKGVVAFWSATVSPGFEEALDTFGWEWERDDIALIPGRVDAMHYIYICRPAQKARYERAA
ncbi:spermidine synthase [Paracoccus kondratievae]|nr:hypothetical protein [Paracoccus kondratievae]